MKRRGAIAVLSSGLILAAQGSWMICRAQTTGPQAEAYTTTSAAANSAAPPDGTSNPPPAGSIDESSNTQAPEYNAYSNSLGPSLFKNFLSDQKTIWSSPAHLHWGDGTWLFPLAAVSTGLFLTDRALAPALSANPATLNRYVSISNYGLYSMGAAVGGFYLWGRFTHDDQRRETGILAGEAAINSFVASNVLEYSLGRERPDQGQGQGDFFHNGTSFPSDHSAIAWSVASVIAHEYPGPLTKVLVYGLASAVSVSRVAGEQHFPSDSLVGGVIGWLIGREVYNAHHDPELPGVGRESLAGDGDEQRRDRKNMGSPSVPLDSWVYPAFERLAAQGAINTQLMGVKPWTRMECARLTEEAAEALQDGGVVNAKLAAQLESQLAQEFAYEMNLLGGGHNLTANVESVYTRAVSISGPALTDSSHFGQTISDDFGRPYESGFNAQAGGSVSASAGPLTIYMRAEYQHAPSAPGPSGAEINAISFADQVPAAAVQSGPIAPTNQIQLLDTYAGANLGNWQLTIGRQSLSWTTAPDGSLIWSDNIVPVDMVRLANPEPLELPSILRHLGPVRVDQFFGRLETQPYVPHPFILGEKVSIKPWSFLELGFARTIEIGGEGSGNPLTTTTFVQSFFGIQNRELAAIPGKTSTEQDWILYIPKIRNYLVFYGDAYAADDFLPMVRPLRNPWRPGIYVTRFPGLPRLDLHVEGVSTEQNGFTALPGYPVGAPRSAVLNYWNSAYRNGYTNGGNIIGNSVGRDGRTVQGWITYWLSSRNSLQVLYRNNSVSADFIPGGGAWQDYAVRNEIYLQKGFYLKTELQFENIARYPILFAGREKNVTAIVELGFLPQRQAGLRKNEP